MVWFSSCDYDYYNVVLSTTEAGYMVLIDSEWPGKYSNLKAAIRSEYSDPELVKAILSKL